MPAGRQQPDGQHDHNRPGQNRSPDAFLSGEPGLSRPEGFPGSVFKKGLQPRGGISPRGGHKQRRVRILLRPQGHPGGKASPLSRPVPALRDAHHLITGFPQAHLPRQGIPVPEKLKGQGFVQHDHMRVPVPPGQGPSGYKSPGIQLKISSGHLIQRNFPHVLFPGGKGDLLRRSVQGCGGKASRPSLLRLRKARSRRIPARQKGILADFRLAPEHGPRRQHHQNPGQRQPGKFPSGHFEPSFRYSITAHPSLSARSSIYSTR